MTSFIYKNKIKNLGHKYYNKSDIMDVRIIFKSHILLFSSDTAMPYLGLTSGTWVSFFLGVRGRCCSSSSVAYMSWSSGDAAAILSSSLCCFASSIAAIFSSDSTSRKVQTKTRYAKLKSCHYFT